MTEEGKPNPDNKAELGILFVHGIGQQAEGDTLVQFGDPLVRWLQRWLGQAEDGDPSEDRTRSSLLVADSWPRAGQYNETAPAVALLRRAFPGTGEKQQWLLAESHWAESFASPNFSDLARWGLGIYPWTNATHFGTHIRRTYLALQRLESSFWKIVLFLPFVLWAIVYFLASLLLSCVVLALILALLILAIPPIPRLRAVLLGLQRKLQITAGDSFILLSSPIQYAAIVGRVRRDLRWLLDHCDKVAIVAHSQGAAVSYLALRGKTLSQDEAARVQLITFGSGLAKLEGLRRCSNPREQSDLWRWTNGWLPIAGLAAVLAGIHQGGFLNLPGPIFLDTAWVTIVTWAGAILWMFGLVSAPKTGVFSPEDFDPEKQFGAKLRWQDYYASADPVSNGALFDKTPGYLNSQKVHNYAAAWRDHTSYWSNADGFVALLARDICDHLGHPLPSGEQLARALVRRRWRVRLLATLRLLVLAATVVSLYAFWRHFDSLGIGLWDAFLSVTAESEGLIPGFLKARWLQDSAPALLAFLPVLVVGGMLYALLLALWQWQNRIDMDAQLPRGVYRVGLLAWTLMIAAWLLANFILFAAAGWLDVMVGLLARKEDAIALTMLIAPGALTWIPLMLYLWPKKGYGAAFESSLFYALLATLALLPLSGLAAYGFGTGWLRHEQQVLGLAVMGGLVLAGLVIGFWLAATYDKRLKPRIAAWAGAATANRETLAATGESDRMPASES